MCKHCGKRFAEDNAFAPKYYRVTLRLIDDIFKKTESERSFTSIAKEVNLSVSTVIRFFDMLAFNPPKKRPEVISIDELKGNPYDNALAENFFSILKTECIYRKKLQIYQDARFILDQYIHFYNNARIQFKKN